MKIKTKLKKLRMQTKITQSKIAGEANISVMSYQRYESGECIPNVRTAILIAKALNSTVEELFGDILLDLDSNNSSN